MSDGGAVISQTHTHPMDWQAQGSGRWPTFCSGVHSSSDVSDKGEEGRDGVGEVGGGQRAGSPLLWVRGVLMPQSTKKTGPIASPEMPTKAAHLCLGILCQSPTTQRPGRLIPPGAHDLPVAPHHSFESSIEGLSSGYDMPGHGSSLCPPPRCHTVFAR